MYDKNKAFKFEVDPNFDFILEERANTYIALRKIKWGDSTESKLDIRKYVATEDGERMMKGCSFTDEGAHELTKVMLEQGYGKDKEIFDAIINNRPEITSRFIEEIKGCSDKELEDHLKNYPIPQEESETEYYDLGDLLEE